MFDDQAFSNASFERSSWLMTALVVEPDDEDRASPFNAGRRFWRPPLIEQLPPPKRKRKRRQADILFLGH